MAKQYQKVKAIFKPCRMDDLREFLIPLIGEIFEFQYMWIADCGQFEGQWVLTTRDDRFQGHWVPECDLEILECLEQKTIFAVHKHSWGGDSVTIAIQ